MEPKSNEYDYIDVIGETSETFKNHTEKLLNKFAHKKEVESVRQLLPEKIPDMVLDLGCSIGSWFDDYKKLGFKTIIGIDISQKRLDFAKKRGYNEVHCCNAYDTPFEDNIFDVIISNDVFVHIINDKDKVKVLSEVYRILKPGGHFIFNIANAKGFGHQSDKTIDYCRFLTPFTMLSLIPKGFSLVDFIPSYSYIPRIFAHPNLVDIGVNLVYPITNSFTSLDNAKVVYFDLKKKNQ